MRRLLTAVMLIMVMVGIPALTDRADAAGYNPYPWGQCTWYAYSMRPDLGIHFSGNAANWAYSARVSGANVGYTPRTGAIVVFQAGVQGAWGAGHVGYVVAVGRNGTFLVAESHFPYLGRITHRWAHSGRGVSFIY